MSEIKKLTIKDLKCATCTRKDCDLSNEHLEDTKKTNILDVGRIMIMRCTTEMHGCASHPLALQVIVVPVIEELEKEEKDRIFIYEHSTTMNEETYNQGIIWGIQKAINLLKGSN